MNTTIYFDFETGGVQPHHPNTSLAGIAVADGREIENFYHLIQFDQADAEEKALEVNRYDPERWKAEALPEIKVAQKFSEFLSRHRCITLTSQRTGRPYSVARLAGYNSASFDGPRLDAMFDRYQLFPCWRRPTLDVLQLTIDHHDRLGLNWNSFKLSTVAAALGVQLDGAHDALVDCRMTAAIHSKLREAVGATK